MADERPSEHPAAEEFQHHRLIRRHEMRPFWAKNARSGEIGFIRATLTPVDSTFSRAGLAMLYPGQTSPARSYSTEHILLHLQGDVILSVEGEQYRLGSQDLIFIPAFVDFEQHNCGTDVALTFSVNLRLDEWPGRTFSPSGEVVEQLGREWPADDRGRWRA